MIERRKELNSQETSLLRECNTLYSEYRNFVDIFYSQRGFDPVLSPKIIEQRVALMKRYLKKLDELNACRQAREDEFGHETQPTSKVTFR